MTDRISVRVLDPLDGAVGDGIVIGSDGQFTIGPVGSSGGGGFAGGIETVYTLYGPEPEASKALSQASTGGYVWPGAALSTSTLLMRFDLDLPEIVYARWLVVWVPRNTSNALRLVHADDGPTNITQFAEITGRSETTPVVSSVDLTATLNSLRSAGAYKQLGNQINTGATAPTIHLSRIEIVWAGAAGTGTGAASGITVDDSGFAHISGVDVQAALASIDAQLGAPAAPSTYREALMATGITPPEPLESSDGTDWLYGEVSS